MAAKKKGKLPPWLNKEAPEKKGEDKPKEKAPGFKAVQKKIQKKSGVSKEAAGAILAESTRNASPEAKKKNPNLKKVKGPKSKTKARSK